MLSWTTLVVHNRDQPKNFELKNPPYLLTISYKQPSWMSIRIVYICEQLLSLYANVSRSFGVLYNFPSCSSCFTGLHHNQNKLQSLKNVKPSLKYFHPGLGLFKIFIFQHGQDIWDRKTPACTQSIIKPWTNAYCESPLLGRDLTLKIVQIFFDNSCE